MCAVFKNLFIATLCLRRFLIRGRAVRRIKNPSRIIIVQLARLGDVVCTTPLFSAVKRRYPKCFLSVIGQGAYKDLLSGNPEVDKYISWDNDFCAVLRKVKSEKADFACITNPSFRGLAVLYLAGIPLISAHKVIGGRSPYETRLYKLIRNFVIAVPHKMGKYAPREYLQLLGPIGINEPDMRKHLYYSPRVKDVIRRFFMQAGINERSDFIVCIFPSAGNRIKIWEAEKFASVAEHLVRHYKAKIIISGGKNDCEIVDKMIERMPIDVPFTNVAGVFSLEELKVLIDSVNLVICVDSGPIYIAEAFGVPTIDIVGPMDENEQPPRNGIHRIVVCKKRAESMLHVMNARVYNKEEARRQIEAISSEMVIKEIDSLMKMLKRRAEKG